MRFGIVKIDGGEPARDVIAGDGNIGWIATVGRAYLEFASTLTRVAVGERPTPLYRRRGTPRRASWS